MHLHKEGFTTILISTIVFLALQLINIYVIKRMFPNIALFLVIVVTVCFFIVIWFFRIPHRVYTKGENLIVAPADGKIVVIEEKIDNEYFKTKRIQVSIFMNPLNVHVQRYPINGEIIYSKYHPGNYFIASYPKSSDLNERHSVVLKKGKFDILVKQIAGALARRIVNYSHVGEQAVQNEEMGFIKFGSRVDLLLPLGTKINVKMNEKVQGGITVIGEIQP